MSPGLILPLAGIRLGSSGPAGLGLGVLLIALAVGVGVMAYRRTQPDLSSSRRTMLTSLRVAVLLLVAVMLAEPVLFQREETTLPPGVVLLVDQSGSMGIRSSAGTARIDDALHLRDRVAAFLKAREGTHRIWMAQGARRVTESIPAEEYSSATSRTSSEGTDLRALVLSAAQRHLEDNIRAIVLFSDGVTTTRNSPSLAGLDVPVFTVALGDTVGPADLRLDRVHYPPLVYRGEKARIDAEVVASGANGGTAWAVLREGGAAIDSVLVSWGEGGGRQELAFEVDADSVGSKSLELEVAALPGEPLAENNAVQIGIEVRKDRLRVMYVEARPSWNAHFAARLAQDDTRFDLRVVHRAETGWRMAGTDSTWTVPTEREAAGDVDLWILGSPSDLRELLAAGVPLNATVAAGAGVLVLPGVPSGQARVSPPPDMLRLPLRFAYDTRWELGRHRARPTVAGRGHPVLAMPPELTGVEDRLLRMPPLWGVLSGMEPASDADVLLQAEGPRSRLPLLAVRNEGAGRVAVWTGAPLWSWSFWRLGASDESEDLFRALGGNLLYFLAEGGDRTRLRLNLPQPVLAQGQDALVRATALDARLQPDSRVDVWLEWALGGAGAVDSLTVPQGRSRMQLDSQTPGGRVLTMPGLVPGTYAMRVALEEGETRVTSPWKSLVIDPYSVEFQRPAADMAALQQLSRLTGGRSLRPADLQDWARDVELHPRQTVLAARVDLWDSAWVFIPLLLLLTTEWVLRKRWGLV